MDDTYDSTRAADASSATTGAFDSNGYRTTNPRAPRQRRSHSLTLVFISAAAVGFVGCGRLEENKTSRDVYANLEECRADWGNPEDCEEIDEKRSATGSRVFYGPRYTSRTGSYGGGYTTTTRPGSRAKGTVNSGGSSSRGGFGSSSSRHSGSSSSGG